MIRFLFVIFICVFFEAYTQNNTPAFYVNPFVGTAGTGHTYPGASRPFGMVQLSPDTRLTGWEGCSGYHFSDSLIYGFSHTHLSGTGCSDFGDILFLPFTGNVSFKSGINKSKFRHSSEVAKAGFYKVFLDDCNIVAELTATKRTGFHRYKFLKSDISKVLLDLTHRDEVLESSLEIVGRNAIQGMRRSKSWAKNQYVFFYAEFSQPFDKTEIAVNEVLQTTNKVIDSKDIKAVFSFNKIPDGVLLVKVGVSLVDINGAKANLLSESAGWNFDEKVKESTNEWNNELSKIKVASSNERLKTIFYTALYHCMLAPNVNSDIDGRYRGMDNKIHKAEGFDYYSVFSLWDTNRALHPLFTIIDRKRTLHFIKTFEQHYKQSGRLPMWELASNETDCMIGYHAVSVISDAFAKGIKEFNTDMLLKAMIEISNENKYGKQEYKKRNYLSVADESESVSKTLEYAYNDWCIAEFAKKLGDLKIANEYYSRSLNYRNIFDKETGFMRPKINGYWQQNFDPFEVNNNFTEANSWQYSFYAPHDLSGLVKMHGGKEKLETKLDELFSAKPKTTGRSQADITGLLGQYAHGNEPSHHIAYLYSYVGKPNKTQEIVSRIMRDFYSSKEDGLIGNEDCGQMSAWYVMSALGFYQVTPGSVDFVLGAPAFDEAYISLENGKVFTVKAENAGEKNVYVSDVVYNEHKVRDGFIKYDQILSGGEMVFKMTDKPEIYFNSDILLETSKVDDNNFCSTPIIVNSGSSFRDSIKIEILHNNPTVDIFYRLDSITGFNKYSTPFYIDRSMGVYSYAINKSGSKSGMETAEFVKFPNKWKVKIFSKYNRQYTAGGDYGIIDGIRGSENWRKGFWQGYQSDDLRAVIDLGKLTDVSEIVFGFLQDSRSWILFPRSVEIEFSSDSINFSDKIIKKINFSASNENILVEDISIALTDKKPARYIKIKVENFGRLPEWHQGAGSDAFIFIDEIKVK